MYAVILRKNTAARRYCDAHPGTGKDYCDLPESRGIVSIPRIKLVT
jgi:hypothetical protein